MNPVDVTAHVVLRPGEYGAEAWIEDDGTFHIFDGPENSIDLDYAESLKFLTFLQGLLC